ncbi:MAG: hypothetical protein ABI652_00820 [Acidobacteriota bacterium]
MRRPVVPAVLLLAFSALTAGACGSSPTTPTTPSTTVATVTEVFTGRLSVNGAVNFPFTVSTAGVISLTLQALDPDPDATAAIGLSLGTWNGTVCTVQLPNDRALAGSVILGSAAGAGPLCARVSDATGNLTAPISFSIAVVHL